MNWLVYFGNITHNQSGSSFISQFGRRWNNHHHSVVVHKLIFSNMVSALLFHFARWKNNHTHTLTKKTTVEPMCVTHATKMFSKHMNERKHVTYLLSMLVVAEDWRIFTQWTVRCLFCPATQSSICTNIHSNFWKIAPISFKNVPNTTFVWLAWMDATLQLCSTVHTGFVLCWIIYVYEIFLSFGVVCSLTPRTRCLTFNDKTTKSHKENRNEFSLAAATTTAFTTLVCASSNPITKGMWFFCFFFFFLQSLLLFETH